VLEISGLVQAWNGIVLLTVVSVEQPFAPLVGGVRG